MDGIWLVIKEAATSKKLITAIAGSITAAFLKIGLELPTETVAAILAPLMAYILGQGWADRGKEAAKIEGAVRLASEGVKPTEAVKEKLV